MEGRCQAFARRMTSRKPMNWSASPRWSHLFLNGLQMPSLQLRETRPLILLPIRSETRWSPSKWTLHYQLTKQHIRSQRSQQELRSSTGRSFWRISHPSNQESIDQQWNRQRSQPMKYSEPKQLDLRLHNYVLWRYIRPQTWSKARLRCFGRCTVWQS